MIGRELISVSAGIVGGTFTALVIVVAATAIANSLPTRFKAIGFLINLPIAMAPLALAILHWRRHLLVTHGWKSFGLVSCLTCLFGMWCGLTYFLVTAKGQRLENSLNNPGFIFGSFVFGASLVWLLIRRLSAFAVRIGTALEQSSIEELNGIDHPTRRPLVQRLGAVVGLAAVWGGFIWMLQLPRSTEPQPRRSTELQSPRSTEPQWFRSAGLQTPRSTEPQWPRSTEPQSPPSTEPQPPRSTEPQLPRPGLSPGELETLVKQGQQFVASGDFLTGRLVFERAADAGSAAAALALGASYDPIVLSRLGVRGVDMDVAKARAWYQRAKDLGAPDANRRLEALANH